MYLMRIALNTERRETMRALACPGILHGAVQSLCNGERERILWRTDVLHNVTYLLMLSASKLDCSHIAEQFGFAGDVGDSKDYATLLSHIQAGRQLRFRLCANPVKSASKGSANGRGRIYAHVTHEQQKQWLLERAEQNGFALNADEFDVTDTRWENFKKHVGDKRDVTIRKATFEGVLTVTDATLFKEALTGGIGRAKAYGCGLITVMRID